jgi:hypothetical protein
MAQHALTEEASPHKLRPKELLQKGYNSVVADESITAGGTTASVGVAQTDGSVELAKYVFILVATGMIPANEGFSRFTALETQGLYSFDSVLSISTLRRKHMRSIRHIN